MSADSIWTWRLDPFIRSLIGLFLAPLTAGAAAGFIAGLLIGSDFLDTSVGAGGMLAEVSFVTFAGVAMAATFGLPWSFAAGWPVHLLLLWSGRTHILIYAGAGALIAVAALRAVTLVDPEDGVFIVGFTTASIALTAASGLLGGAMFWFIRRPGRLAADTPDPQQPAKAAPP
jgi:hypothetical protein